MQTQNGSSFDIGAMTKPAWEKTKKREQILAAWLESKTALETAKAAENALREQVVEAYPFDTEEGTQRVPLANGYELKVVKKLNYTLDNKLTDAALDKLEAIGAEGKFIAERLVSWKPSLSVAEYRKLNPQMRGIVDEVLTVKPGLPTLELVEPKTKS